MWVFCPHQQAILSYHLGVLQVSSILTLCGDTDVRSHRLRTLSYKTAPAPTSPGLLPYNGLQTRVATISFSGLMYLLEWLTEIREMLLLDDWFVIKDIAQNS